MAKHRAKERLESPTKKKSRDTQSSKAKKMKQAVFDNDSSSDVDSFLDTDSDAGYEGLEEAWGDDDQILDELSETDAVVGDLDDDEIPTVSDEELPVGSSSSEASETGSSGSDDSSDEIIEEDSSSTISEGKADSSLRKVKSKREDDSARHAKELKMLAEFDPSFHKFLQENDSGLLEFDAESAGEDGDSMSHDVESVSSTCESESDEECSNFNEDEIPISSDEDNEQSADAEDVQQDKKEQLNTLTMDQVLAWVNELNNVKRVAPAIRSILRAFYDCTRHEDITESSESSKEGKIDMPRIWSIDNDAVFNKVLVISMTQIPKALNRVLMLESISDKKIVLPSRSPKFSGWLRYIRLYAASLVHLHSQGGAGAQAAFQNDEQSNSSSAARTFALRSLEAALPYFASVHVFARRLLKALLEQWSNALMTDVQLCSFVAIRTLMKITSSGTSQLARQFSELGFKSLYVTYARHTKAFNVHNSGRIQTMAHCVITLARDLIGDGQFDLVYRVAFGQIRQMALLLRAAVQEPTQMNLTKIYQWPYLHSLLLWSRVLSESMDDAREAVHQANVNVSFQEHPLYALVYPMTQLLCGSIRLQRAASYFPFVIHCLRALVELGRASMCTTPAISYLLDVAAAAQYHSRRSKHHDKAILKAYDGLHTIRMSKSHVNDPKYRDGVLEDAVDSLVAAVYAQAETTQAAFIEASVPIVLELKRILRTTRHVRVRQRIQELLSKIHQVVQLWQEVRINNEETPSSVDVSALANGNAAPLKPLKAHLSALRDMELRKQAILRESAMKTPETMQKNESEDDD